MDIFLFTDSKTIGKHFESLKRSRTFNLIIHPVKKLKNVIKGIQIASFIYLDVASMDEAEIKRTIGTLAKASDIRFGVVDQAGIILDPATLFHRDAVDYLNKAAIKEGISANRIKAALEVRPFDEELKVDESAHQSVDKSRWKLTGDGWKGVKSGQEYTFCMLLIEIDMAAEWTQKSGKAHLDEVTNLFHNHVERIFNSMDGKIWMWMNRSGLVLFPFNGESISAVLSCIRLVLNRTIISAEDYPYNTVITYRMILHVGNTVYRSRGKTGTIVSDTINFLFHMGKQFSQRGHFYITAPAVPFIPDQLKNVFIPAGTFEGVEISKMRLPKD